MGAGEQQVVKKFFKDGFFHSIHLHHPEQHDQQAHHPVYLDIFGGRRRGAPAWEVAGLRTRASL